MKKVEDYNFRKDIKDGEKGEKIITNYLESYGFKLLSDNKNNKYDLLMLTDKKVETTIEVKTDVYCFPTKTEIIEGVSTKISGRDTGNMFIEFECRKKPSGIAVTEARWFVYYYPHLNEAWFISVSELKKLIKENNFRTTEFSGDKGSGTKGYLIRRKDFTGDFKVRKIDTQWD